MAPKKKSKGETGAEVGPTTTVKPRVDIASASSTESLLSTTTSQGSSDVVKVNNASLTELKNALDDSAKAFFSKSDSFTQSYLHEDIRIGFGWLSCIVAAGVSFHGYKNGWQSTRGWTIFAVTLYAFISGMLWLYAKFVEKDTVYVGIRRGVDKRIMTERLTYTSTVPPHTPLYNITLNYTSSTNGGKSMIRSHSSSVSPSFAQFFDVNGRLDCQGWETFLSGLLSKALGD